MRPIGQSPAKYRLARAAFFDFLICGCDGLMGDLRPGMAGILVFQGLARGGRDQQERTGRFWSRGDGEAILALRALRLSQDDRGDNFLLHRKLIPAA